MIYVLNVYRNRIDGWSWRLMKRRSWMGPSTIIAMNFEPYKNRAAAHKNAVETTGLPLTSPRHVKGNLRAHFADVRGRKARSVPVL